MKIMILPLLFDLITNLYRFVKKLNINHTNLVKILDNIPGFLQYL